MMASPSLQRLQYFSVIAREGSLVRAAKVLQTTHSNLSMQMRLLEQELEGDLFERRGRRLILTALGSEVAWYADEISRLGNDVTQIAQGLARRSPLRVGIVGAIPKALAYRLLEPALAVSGFGPVVSRQDGYGRLLEELAAGRLHLVLSDLPPPQGGSMRLFGHLLGASDILLYATAALAAQVKGPLPAALADIPLLLPARETGLRRAIERWLATAGVNARIEGEFDDVGLMRIFGLRGRGVFPVRAAMRAELEDMSRVVALGTIPDLRERYYAISVERRVHHPAVSALIDSARARLSDSKRSSLSL